MAPKLPMNYNNLNNPDTNTTGSVFCLCPVLYSPQCKHIFILLDFSPILVCFVSPLPLTHLVSFSSEQNTSR